MTRPRLLLVVMLDLHVTCCKSNGKAEKIKLLRKVFSFFASKVRNQEHFTYFGLKQMAK
jgi:hypothetical protein